MRTIFGSYSNCVNFGADETGLYMAVFRPFRFGHAPLFIPWSEIQVDAHSQGFIFKSRKLAGASGSDLAFRQVITG
jgi:hypothetical protein